MDGHEAFLKSLSWLKEQPVPELGDDDATEDSVNSFYTFWYNTDSWREFGYHDEVSPAIGRRPCRSAEQLVG